MPRIYRPAEDLAGQLMQALATHQGEVKLLVAAVVVAALLYLIFGRRRRR